MLCENRDQLLHDLRKAESRFAAHCRNESARVQAGLPGDLDRWLKTGQSWD
jgi:hypothetical protein